MLDFKCDGTFVDIGANAPTWSSNTYLLEKDYGYRGLCVDQQFFVDFAETRPKSTYIIHDALTLDYANANQLKASAKFVFNRMYLKYPEI